MKEIKATFWERLRGKAKYAWSYIYENEDKIPLEQLHRICRTLLGNGYQTVTVEGGRPMQLVNTIIISYELQSIEPIEDMYELDYVKVYDKDGDDVDLRHLLNALNFFMDAHGDTKTHGCHVTADKELADFFNALNHICAKFFTRKYWDDLEKQVLKEALEIVRS